MNNDDNVVSLFGLDFPEGDVGVGETTSEEILEKVRDVNFDKVVVIGISEDNMLGFSTNLRNNAELIFVIEKLKNAIINEAFND